MHPNQQPVDQPDARKRRLPLFSQPCRDEILDHPLRAKEHRSEQRNREQKIQNAACQVNPKIAQAVHLLASEPRTSAITTAMPATAQVSPDLAFNTVISFLSNTDWQAYSGESTLSYLVQMRRWS